MGWTQFTSKFTGILVLAILAGCDQTERALKEVASTGPRDGTHTNIPMSAGAILDRCIKSYQSLNQYEDAARVRLQYKLDGSQLEDVAPLSIALERPSRLGIRAYRVEAGVTQDRWRMRVGPDDQSPLPNQVVSRNLPEKVDLEWLNTDAVAMQFLSAGLAGFPPQLDLLLSASPLKGLIDDSAVVTFGGAELIDNSSCYMISVVRASAEYRLWIDQRTMLVRRFELPQSSLPPAMLDDRRVKDVRLFVDFLQVKINQPIDWSKWRPGSSQTDQLMTHFVPPPPSLPTDALGKSMPAITLKSHDERAVLSTGDSGPGKITVLMWLADHVASRTSAAQLGQVARSLPKEMREQIQFAAVWAEPRPPADTALANMAEKWQLNMPVAVDRQAIGRDVFSIREAPTLIVLDRNNRLQIMEERGNPRLAEVLPGILQRLADGDDLAGQIVRDSRMDRERFAAELWLSSAIDADLQVLQRPNSYPPRFVKLKQLDRKVFDQEIAILASDVQQLTWTLFTDGTLERSDAIGKVEREFATTWKQNPFDIARMQVSPAGQFVALHARNSHKINLLDVAAGQERSINLSDSQFVTDFAWLAAQESQSPRLAILTSDQRTLLVDPIHQRQMSGQCPAEPIAVLPQDSTLAAAGNGLVVLNNGLVEPLVLSDPDPAAASADRTLAKPASFGKPERTELQPSSRQLGFQPAIGPWSLLSDKQGTAMLGFGWLALNEPAVYLLDSRLQLQWHYRLPLMRGESAWPISATARDPLSGQPVFVITQPNRFVHILRADGVLSDHFQTEEPIRGISLVCAGDKLNMIVAHPHARVRYELLLPK